MYSNQPLREERSSGVQDSLDRGGMALALLDDHLMHPLTRQVEVFRQSRLMSALEGITQQQIPHRYPQLRESLSVSPWHGSPPLALRRCSCHLCPRVSVASTKSRSSGCSSRIFAVEVRMRYAFRPLSAVSIM